MMKITYFASPKMNDDFAALIQAGEYDQVILLLENYGGSLSQLLLNILTNNPEDNHGFLFCKFIAKDDNHIETICTVMQSEFKQPGDVHQKIFFHLFQLLLTHENETQLQNILDVLSQCISHFILPDKKEPQKKKISYKSNFIQFLNEVDKLNSTQRETIFHQLVFQSFKNTNLEFLFSLYQHDENAFSSAIKHMKATEIEIINKFLSLANDARINLVDYMSEFTAGFGHMTWMGGVITCAQIHSRKKDYIFNPVILEDGDGSCNNFDAYLAILKKAPKPIRERFIITGEHWLCGDIQINEKGQVNILLLDSLGIASSSYVSAINVVFPDSKIYMAENQRQHAFKGCSAFALDDVRHLFTAERYLDETYSDSGLFGFLSTNAYKKTADLQELKKKSTNIFQCKLPLSLERTTQSSNLLALVIPGRSKKEQDMPVNKKGQTAMESAREHFTKPKEKVSGVKDTKDEKETKKVKKEKPKNLRIKYKLKKIADQNLVFLLNCPQDAFVQSLRPFTLEGLRARMLPEQTFVKGARFFSPGSKIAEVEFDENNKEIKNDAIDDLDAEDNSIEFKKR